MNWNDWARYLSDHVEQLLLIQHAFGDDFGVEDDPADCAGAIVPGIGFPGKPIHPAIGALPGIFLLALDRSIQAALVYGFPLIGDIGKDFIMRAPDNVLVAQPIVGEPAPAGHDVA